MGTHRLPVAPRKDLPAHVPAYNLPSGLRQARLLSNSPSNICHASLQHNPESIFAETETVILLSTPLVVHILCLTTVLASIIVCMASIIWADSTSEEDSKPEVRPAEKPGLDRKENKVLGGTKSRAEKSTSRKKGKNIPTRSEPESEAPMEGDSADSGSLYEGSDGEPTVVVLQRSHRHLRTS
jgi:hypothetical protein